MVLFWGTMGVIRASIGACVVRNFFCICLALTSSPAHSANCDLGSEIVENYMLAKELISAGKYNDFMDKLVSISVPDIEAARSVLVGFLSKTSSSGFNNCAQIQENKFSGNLYSEVIAFSNAPGRFIFVRFILIRENDKWTLLDVKMADSIKDVLVL